MKRTIVIMLALSILAFAAYGQVGWGWQGGFSERADTLRTEGHGIAVDGAGNIWYQPYYSTEFFLEDTGSGTADSEHWHRGVYVFNPDGTELSFSPITTVTYGSQTDTLFNSARGLRTDMNGDVVIATWWEYYRINHLTGAGMDHLLPEDSVTVTAPAFTADNEMIVQYVTPGDGVDIYNADWSHLDKAIIGDDAPSYSRTIEVAKDGSAIYRTAYSSSIGFVRYNSSDGTIYGDFNSSKDTLAVGLQVASTAWQPVTNYLWGGSNGGNGWTWGAHFAFDPANDFALVDSIVIPSIVGTGNPRGIAFDALGTTAYLTFFGGADLPIYEVKKGAVGVWEHTGTFVSGYSMKANYPNPFNPSTKLDVAMKEAGVADLRVYDLRGAEVAVLNSSYLSAGDHSFTFNGNNLAAGVYIAKFMVNGAMYTQNMTLIK